MTAVAGATEGVGNLSPQGAKAYLNLLDAAEKQYGVAHIATESPYNRMWEGISLAKLVDFDGDGVPELYYAAKSKSSSWIQRLYTIQNGKVLQLKIPERVSNFNTDLAPTTLLYIGADKAYLVDGQETMNGNPVNYFTKKGNEIVSDFVYTESNFEDWTINGKVVSHEKLTSLKNAFVKGMTKVEYSFWAFDSQNNESLNATVTGTRNELWNRAYILADPSTDKLTVDGKLIEMPVYKIHGNNYYMLRRLAYALSGTDAQFDVDWDEQMRQVTLTKNKPYTPVGGETDSFNLTMEGAMLTDASISLNGQPLTPTVYNIKDNNFFKLRDLAQALDFGVEWDNTNRTVQINTKRSYNDQSDAEADAQGENLILTAHGGVMRVLNTFLSCFSETSFAYNTAFTSGDMEQTVKEYFNVDIKHQSTSRYTYENNQYYTSEDVNQSYNYCSIADEMYLKNDGTYSVHFVVFSTPGMSITQLMDEDEVCFLASAESSSYLERAYEGAATLGRKTEGGYYLISYQVDKT